MFRCDSCEKVTQPGQKMTKVVTKTRPKVYYDAFGNVEGAGTEIVKESKLGPCCTNQEGEDKK